MKIIIESEEYMALMDAADLNGGRHGLSDLLKVIRLYREMEENNSYLGSDPEKTKEKRMKIEGRILDEINRIRYR